jgi:hypothetical protein
VRYPRSGDVSIAYQVVGEGPQPIFVDFCRRAASLSRLILFDKRGTGLSDRPREMPTRQGRGHRGAHRCAYRGGGEAVRIARVEHC